MLRRPRSGLEKARPPHSDLPVKHIAVEGLVVGAVKGHEHSTAES
ncbi:hypothetical protein ACFYY1_25225 [Streptomyces sp. NPDC001890]